MKRRSVGRSTFNKSLDNATGDEVVSSDAIVYVGAKAASTAGAHRGVRRGGRDELKNKVCVSFADLGVVFNDLAV